MTDVSTASAAAFKPIVIELNKKNATSGKYEKIGEQTIHCPTLLDVLPFITSPVKKDEKGAEVYDDGLPVFEDDKANWLQGAILAAVKAQARNKMVPGTATLKDGSKIATNWEELIAEGVRDGSGLKLMHEFKKAFAEWVAKLGLSDATANTLIALVGNKTGLQLQQQSTKDKVAARLAAFAESLEIADAERFMRPMESAMKACEALAEDPTADL